MNYLGNNDLREQSISGRVDEGRVGIKARKLCWLMSESPLLAARLPSCWDSCELGLRVVLECVKCPLVLVCFAHCWANSHFTAWNSYPGKRKHTELESCQYSKNFPLQMVEIYQWGKWIRRPHRNIVCCRMNHNTFLPTRVSGKLNKNNLAMMRR